MGKICKKRLGIGRAGFTLIELLLTMGMIAALLSVVLPNIRAMIAEGQLTKVDGELSSIKTAVTSYWRNNTNVYPPNIHSALVNATPQMISQVMPDPFNTDLVNQTYGYATGDDSTFGPYFIIYSKGPKGDTLTATFDSAHQWIAYTGGGRVVSNAPVVKLP